MRHRERPRTGLSGRRLHAVLERLESREQPAASGSTSLFVTAAYGQFIDDLHTLETRSKATPTEYLALRDDARMISQAASAASLNLSTAQTKANLASTILDRSVLDGSLGPAGWADVQARLTTDLSGLGVSQPLINQTFADIQATASSSRVTAADYQQLSKDMSALSTSEEIPGNLSYGDMDPSLYLAQHLGGFFRGWAVQRTTDVATLKSDLKTIPSSVDASSADRAALQQEVQLLEKIGAKIPSASNAQLLSIYGGISYDTTGQVVSASQVGESIESTLGGSIKPAQGAEIEKILTNAPKAYQAVGASPTNLATITNDVQAVVNDGVSSAPNPFKVVVTKNS